MAHHLTTHIPRDDPLPRRWRRLVDLLQERPRLTIREIASALEIEPGTAATYLSEARKVVPIRGEGEWGETRYFLDATQED